MQQGALSELGHRLRSTTLIVSGLTLVANTSDATYTPKVDEEEKA
jgi:hypothetical protein